MFFFSRFKESQLTTNGPNLLPVLYEYLFILMRMFDDQFQAKESLENT